MKELGSKSLNPKFWFDVTEADLTTQQPWDFTSAKKASMADDGVCYFLLSTVTQNQISNHQ